MRSILMMVAGVLVLTVTGAAARDTYTKGYVRSDGTYVQPHYSSAPDGNRFNNYSTQGNSNPYTGQSGTVDPYKVQEPRIRSPYDGR